MEVNEAPDVKGQHLLGQGAVHDPLGDGLADASTALQTVAVHAHGHKVVINLKF